MKKMLGIILMAALMAGGSTSSAMAADIEPAGEQWGFIFEQLTNPNYVTMSGVALDYCEELGIELQIVDGGESSDTIINAAENMATLGYQVILLSPMAVEIAGTAAEAAKAINPDIIVVGEMRGPEANAAQEAARTGVAVVTTIHSMSCEATYRRMVSLCKRAVDMSDETLMGFVTEAYPIIAFCKQLENKERRLMEIMECEILADGTRRYRPLFQYQITENRVEDGKFVIVGHHRQINPISDSLARRLMENGMPQETLAGLLNVKKDREGENG